MAFLRHERVVHPLLYYGSPNYSRALVAEEALSLRLWVSSLRHTTCTDRAVSSLTRESTDMSIPPPPPYAPATGKVTARQRDAAMDEFIQRVQNGEEDVEVLVARDVPSRKWRGGLHYRVDCFSAVMIEARYSASGRKVDLYMTKVRSDPHNFVVTNVNCQLARYDEANGKMLFVGGGNMELVVPATQQRIDPIRPRLVIEVEFHNRSLEASDRYTREFFELIPQVRAALLFKFFRREPRGGPFACVAILYRRNDQGGVSIADAVSFGSAPLDAASQDFIGHEPLRTLPLAPIPAADILSGAGQVNGTGVPADPAAFPDAQIDLWGLYDRLEWSADFNFE
ncbi:hypothetical protein PHYSODRAFT_307825 [Phytophthora sojae]|uniref:Uncharacterized protein n=1 Tax=Phytophthora sojae (strain P6497) TaxID=1094619 RepID=G5AG84_PHYSP|nr:hypothetical protein PHYSODRAFT_307825 [Phytophthora sojae]EGZ05596.1 hypothetical protein PHYSODRAFT_307825 [Phytophthora sojae]|eukprot:XP_009539127.1 hypothetical protein PHYSODRAFT_307825 [Phytophthora sojae]